MSFNESDFWRGWGMVLGLSIAQLFYILTKNKKKALKKIKELKEKGRDVVTEVKSFDRFYKAKEYHQDYFSKNFFNPYWVYVVALKVKKFKIYSIIEKKESI